jgi:hypothetical protein
VGDGESWCEINYQPGVVIVGMVILAIHIVLYNQA